MNMLIKATAFLLAVLLWFYVISQKSYEKELTLAVKAVDFPEGLGPVTGLPDSLTVKVFAEGQKLLSNDWKRAGLRLKATRLHRGVNNLELNLETVSLVRSEDITLTELLGPTSVQVHLDRLDSSYKPIASRLAVVAANGYAVVFGSEVMEPRQTMVTGPAFVLGRIDSVYTEQKIIDNIKKPIDISLALEIPDTLPVTPSTDSVSFAVQVDKLASRRFENFPVEIGRRTSGHRVIIDPEKITIDVEGPQSVIDSLTESEFKARVFPAASADNEYAIPEITLPENVKLVRVIPDSIRILVEH